MLNVVPVTSETSPAGATMPRRPLTPNPVFQPTPRSQSKVVPRLFGYGRYLAIPTLLAEDGPDIFFDELDRIHTINVHESSASNTGIETLPMTGSTRASTLGCSHERTGGGPPQDPLPITPQSRYSSLLN